MLLFLIFSGKTPQLYLLNVETSELFTDNNGNYDRRGFN